MVAVPAAEKQRQRAVQEEVGHLSAIGCEVRSSAGLNYASPGFPFSFGHVSPGRSWCGAARRDGLCPIGRE